MDGLPSHWDYTFQHGIRGVYEPATDHDRAVFRRFATETKGWNLLTDTSRLKVWDAAGCAGAAAIRVRALLEKVAPAIVYDVLHDPDYRGIWDESMGESYTLETIDGNNDVNYFLGKSPLLGVQHRDFCNMRSWWQARPSASLGDALASGTEMESGRGGGSGGGEAGAGLAEWGIFSRSVPHPKCPKRKGIIRAKSYLTGALIKAHARDAESTVLTYVTQTDMGGDLPRWLMDFLTLKFVPSFVATLDKAARGYAEWKQKNNPTHKPWLGLALPDRN